MSVECTIYLKTTDDGSLAASETRLFSEGNSFPKRVLSALLNVYRSSLSWFKVLFVF